MVTRRAAGFTYLTILFVIVFMGIGLALVGEVWHTSAVREREADLLFVGNQYRRAIQHYFETAQIEPKRYPASLKELLKDDRFANTTRHLRSLYPDPVTGGAEWGLVKAPDGGVMGVYSLSQERPLKSANFRVRDAAFAEAARYSDWKFVYVPDAAPASPDPAPKPPG